jgi:hypothetical protein
MRSTKSHEITQNIFSKRPIFLVIAITSRINLGRFPAAPSTNSVYHYPATGAQASSLAVAATRPLRAPFHFA